MHSLVIRIEQLNHKTPYLSLEALSVARCSMEANTSQPVKDDQIPTNTGQYLIYSLTGCVIIVILSITTLFGNSVILVTIWKTSSLHSASNILLSSLAVSDLAMGLVVQPLFIVYLLAPLGSELLHVLSIFLSTPSLMIITAIGVDRLLALQFHLRYIQVVTPLRVKSVVSFIWLLSAAIASSKLWAGYFFYLIPPATFLCLLVTNLFVYSKIYCVVRRHRRQIQQQQQQLQQGSNDNVYRILRLKKSALKTFLLCIILLLCYLPYSVYTHLQMLRAVASASVLITTVTLVFLNSTLNPLIYCWRDSQIRAAVKQLFYSLI